MPNTFRLNLDADDGNGFRDLLDLVNPSQFDVRHASHSLDAGVWRAIKWPTSAGVSLVIVLPLIATDFSVRNAGDATPFWVVTLDLVTPRRSFMFPKAKTPVDIEIMASVATNPVNTYFI
jgi:hypothetical protein